VLLSVLLVTIVAFPLLAGCNGNSDGQKGSAEATVEARKQAKMKSDK
jgi:hypothetical protein